MEGLRKAAPLVYACVSKGTYVICEYQPVLGEQDITTPRGRTEHENIIATARKNIGDFSRMDDVCHSLVYRGHTINFYRERPYIYVVVAVEKEGGAELPSMVLKRMAAEITPKNRQLPSVIAMTRELKAIIDAGNGVKMTMISQVEDELDAVADIMVENINAVINRGESIASLVDKTSNLGVDARVFRTRAKQVVRKIWWQRAKVHGALVAIILLALYALISTVCGGLSLPSCR
ncbi:hypothetical protein FOZ63_005613, partial [Perkinsus olseni]